MFGRRSSVEENKPTSFAGPNHKILEKRFLSDNTYSLRLERKNLQFKAGQLINVGIPGMGVNREYSIYSGLQDPYLDLLIREVEGGVVSGKLKSCHVGDVVEVHGPYGEFWLSNNIEKHNYLFVATGTGIAPFHCFIKSYPNMNYRIIHGVRFGNECYDKIDYTQGRYTACFSKEKGLGFEGRVTDYLKNSDIPSDQIVYLCGNRSMIIEVYGLMRDKGIPSNQIFTEVFF